MLYFSERTRGGGGGAVKQHVYIILTVTTLVNVYVDLVVFTRITGTS